MLLQCWGSGVVLFCSLVILLVRKNNTPSLLHFDTLHIQITCPVDVLFSRCAGCGWIQSPHVATYMVMRGAIHVPSRRPFSRFSNTRNFKTPGYATRNYRETVCARFASRPKLLRVN